MSDGVVGIKGSKVRTVEDEGPRLDETPET